LLEGLTEKLSIITESLRFVLPEVLLAVAFLVILIIDLITRSRSKQIIQWIAFAFILATFWTDYQQLSITEDNPVHLFLSMLQLDQVAISWKLIIDGAFLLIFFINLQRTSPYYKSEFLSLLFVVVLGGHMLIMSSNLLMVYLSIELMSIGAYILTAYQFKNTSYEAAMKYLLFGGVASAVMIYGISLIYTFTGTLQFEATLIDKLLQVDTFLLLLAGLMVLTGLLFKISAAPMHIWAPDVYEVAPTPAVAFFAVVPKLAAFALLMKWLLFINMFGLGEISWSRLVGGLAVITLTVGNFSALWQTRVKRMLAYSAIAHSGFLLIAITAFSETGYKALLFYALIYVLMNALVFLLVHLFEIKLHATEISDFKGLGKQFPMLTILMVIAMIALTGLPPTAGFTAKLLVFSALWETYSNTQQSWLLFVFVFGLINVVISLFYYLKIPYYMIFKERNDDKLYEVAILENFLALILVLALLIFFFKPEWLMNSINSINFAF